MTDAGCPFRDDQGRKAPGDSLRLWGFGTQDPLSQANATSILDSPMVLRQVADLCKQRHCCRPGGCFAMIAVQRDGSVLGHLLEDPHHNNRLCSQLCRKTCYYHLHGRFDSSYFSTGGVAGWGGLPEISDEKVQVSCGILRETYS